MTEKKITYEDLKPYEFLFTKAPSFILKSMIRKNSNLVSKFEPTIKSTLKKLNDTEKENLYVILDADINELQLVMKEAYKKTHKKQFKLLSQSNAKEFIKLNLAEIKKWF